jgi:nucleoid-associated protein YgaU
MSRYANETPFLNDSEFYEEFFKERNVKYIRHFRSGKIRHPTIKERASLERVRHIWKVGDRFYKLAHRYYGDPSLWWIIAWFNLRPTEGHCETGDLIRIPLPLDRVLEMLRYE